MAEREMGMAEEFVAVAAALGAVAPVVAALGAVEQTHSERVVRVVAAAVDPQLSHTAVTIVAEDIVVVAGVGAAQAPLHPRS
jgi:hypothetical protein